MKYRSDDDIISLEDESGRVEISGSCLEKDTLITGMVVGILGKEVSSGVFEAIDICLPGMAEQDPLPKDNGKMIIKAKKLQSLNISFSSQKR